DIPHEHVVEFNRGKGGALDGCNFNGVRAGMRRRQEFGFPSPVGTGSSARGITGDANFNHLSWLGPAPESVRLSALEDHVVAKNGAEERQREGIASCNY